MQTYDIDIWVSGGGVAGLTAAAVFGTAGFSVLCVDPTPPVTERDAEGSDLRTTAFLQPARGFLHRAGLWDRLEPHASALQIMSIHNDIAPPPLLAGCGDTARCTITVRVAAALLPASSSTL